MGPKKGIPSLVPAHLQRWAILLSVYDYNIRYKSIKNHSNADGPSRLPLPSTLPDLHAQCVATFNNAEVQALPVTFGNIQKATRLDTILGKVYHYVQEGWHNKVCTRRTATLYTSQK